jgi:metal-responsive CopG/Arc/MetJ family transcriptional regulator
MMGLGTKPEPESQVARRKRGKTTELIVVHDHGKRSAELDLIEIVKAEDEALNLLHSRQSDLMSQKALAIAAGDSDDVQYFKGEIIKLRTLIQVRGDELNQMRFNVNSF